MRAKSLALAVLILLAQTARWTDCLCGVVCPRPGECTACPDEDSRRAPEPPKCPHCPKEEQKVPVGQAPEGPTKKCQHVEPQKDILPPGDVLVVDHLSPCPAFLTPVLACDISASHSEVASTASPPDTGPPIFLRIEALLL